MNVIISDKEIPLKTATTFKDKLLGLMFQKGITYCLRLKTNNIHTFFMKETIDIIMTNKDNQIILIKKNLPPNRIIIKKGAYYTYEFPNNTIKHIKIGEYLTLNN